MIRKIRFSNRYSLHHDCIYADVGGAEFMLLATANGFNRVAFSKSLFELRHSFTELGLCTNPRGRRTKSRPGSCSRESALHQRLSPKASKNHEPHGRLNSGR